ncbi:MAG: TadE family protein [Planctomycetota bacterium]
MTTRTSTRRANTRCYGRGARAGATAVEFAIVAPVFFTVVFAMFEFSRVNVLRHTADNAAYEAARVAMVPGATAGDAVAEANRLMGVVGARGVRVAVDPPSLGPATRQVTVSVEVPMSENSLVVSRFTNNATLRSESTLRTERVESR